MSYTQRRWRTKHGKHSESFIHLVYPYSSMSHLPSHAFTHHPYTHISTAPLRRKWLSAWLGSFDAMSLVGTLAFGRCT